MIYGVIVAIQGLYSSFIGAIPGVIAFFIGRFINYSGAQAEELIHSEGKKVFAVDMILEFMARSFFLIGITMIIFILFYGLYVSMVWFY